MGIALTGISTYCVVYLATSSYLHVTIPLTYSRRTPSAARLFKCIPFLFALFDIADKLGVVCAINMEYSKHFIPLESDPDIFTSLIHDLGASPDLCFVDVWDIDDPAQLALIHRPVLALILVFPTSDIYERHKKSQKVDVESYGNGEGEEDILWFKQIINNACGLYAILHAVLNGDARRFIREWASPMFYKAMVRVELDFWLMVLGRALVYISKSPRLLPHPSAQ